MNRVTGCALYRFSSFLTDIIFAEEEEELTTGAKQSQRRPSERWTSWPVADSTKSRCECLTYFSLAMDVYCTHQPSPIYDRSASLSLVGKQNRTAEEKKKLVQSDSRRNVASSHLRSSVINRGGNIGLYIGPPRNADNLCAYIACPAVLRKFSTLLSSLKTRGSFQIRKCHWPRVGVWWHQSSTSITI